MTQYKSKLIIYFIIIPVFCFFIYACSKNSSNNISAPTPAEINFPPNIISSPLTAADHNREYKYIIDVTDPENDILIINVIAPAWLNYNNDSKSISGTASWNNINTYNITIEVSDGINIVEQSYSITVNLGEIICSSDFGDPANSLYILPFQIDKSYKNIQSYCPPNPAWGHHNWFAYDFDMNIGDTIIAMRSGTVIAVQGNYTDANRVSGQENYVFVLHKDGTVASYYHLTKNGPLVSAGQSVHQGDAIGLSGDTGASISPHLHVAVFKGRTNYKRQYSMPINFRNANGPLDSNNGLIYQGTYSALNFTPYND